MAIVAEAGPILCPCCASRAPVIIWSPGQVVGTGAPMLQIVPQHTSMRAELLAPSSADYPRHLAGRLFSVISHGDVEGAENVRRSLSDWLRYMHLAAAGPLAELDRYIGYWKPYATSHQELDADQAVREEVRNAARTLLEAVIAKRKGRMTAAGEDLKQPRQK